MMLASPTMTAASTTSTSAWKLQPQAPALTNVATATVRTILASATVYAWALAIAVTTTFQNATVHVLVSVASNRTRAASAIRCAARTAIAARILRKPAAPSPVQSRDVSTLLGVASAIASVKRLVTVAPTTKLNVTRAAANIAAPTILSARASATQHVSNRAIVALTSTLTLTA